MAHLPNYETWQHGNDRTRIRIARENLRDNPHVVAQWFHLLFTLFKQELQFKRFKVVDEWHRYEWQGRGSTHNHGVYWVDGAPDPDELELSEPARRFYAAYWGIHVGAVNPQPGLARDDTRLGDAAEGRIEWITDTQRLQCALDLYDQAYTQWQEAIEDYGAEMAKWRIVRRIWEFNVVKANWDAGNTGIFAGTLTAEEIRLLRD